jgi:hypothetical protein
MTESALVGSVGIAPFLVRWVFGDLDRDRVHVELLGRVDATDRGQRDEMGVLEGTQRAEVEDRPQVDVEALAPLAGEDPAAVERMNRRLRERTVIRCGADTDVDRRARELVGEHFRLAALDPGHRIELTDVPARAGQAGDRTRVVQEGVRVGVLGGELELVGDRVGHGAAVGDGDLVENVVAEAVEVRSAVRSLERDVVGDQGHRVGMIRAGERVKVSTVSNRVFRDSRCFTMRRHVYPS